LNPVGDVNSHSCCAVYKMLRLGYLFGKLDYHTRSIPTMGASDSKPHMEPILLVERIVKERTK